MLNMLWQNYNNFGLEGRNLFICGVGLGDPDSRSYVAAGTGVKDKTI